MIEQDMTLVADRLYRAGYTEPRLRQFWGGPIASALVRNNAAPAIHFCEKILDTVETQTSFDQHLAALAILFHFRREVSTEIVRAALGESAFDVAVDSGLIVTGSGDETKSGDEVSSTDAATPAEVADSGWVCAPFAVIPYDLPIGVPRGFRPGDENLYLVSDHGTLINPDVLDGDFVLGLGGAGRTLVSLTPREHVGVSADIGTGCGIQALLLARHSDRVIATDISERALHLTGLSAGLNGVTNIELRAGSMLQPLTEPVDLLVSNPPFVITPRTTVATFEYRDGGMTGDRLVRSLFTAIPDHLQPGGRSVCLGNWETTSAADSGPEGWVTDPGTSVLVIEREALDPIAYAETWIRDGGIPRASAEWNQATAAWMDDFETRSVSEVVFGYVIMGKSESASDRESDNDVPTIAGTATVAEAGQQSPTFKTRVRITSAIASNPQGLGQFVATNFALRSWLENATTEELADTVFTRSPDLVEHRHHVPGESDPSSITLEQGIGFGQVFDLDTALAGFVSVADGSLSLRQTAVALAQLLDVNPTALEDQLIAQVRQLVAAGAVLPGTEQPAE
ncbi:MAG: class I SAM-dependent methyltransferase [Brevibacterium sp.]|uniref:class I SAM-dependent methyltransferase n=1 Tax=Brevibacterium sp. TaxID=1701 RepID=UPI0026493BBB|nr:class I SAM-dependent methyltransferase [Brevibacterium sp.]MDN5806279.1 class I SAM-dependent methyltransferase [Brevibacterium sp.]MDN5832904.1 class I SAM-dependent methyltransferase [Brevibacterium sp.]MDN5876073.1 class I SAM-dependent methyltransferase [Brevibacterium sp.]MDN5908891.1 class I SAM-dependent methyltransferase [Brevibacterium sp.]MDN6132764.1 class I SAM-dependent methyltransferase [Brevibacterium sp.]